MALPRQKPNRNNHIFYLSDILIDFYNRRTFLCKCKLSLLSMSKMVYDLGLNQISRILPNNPGLIWELTHIIKTGEFV